MFSDNDLDDVQSRMREPRYNKQMTRAGEMARASVRAQQNRLHNPPPVRSLEQETKQAKYLYWVAWMRSVPDTTFSVD